MWRETQKRMMDRYWRMREKKVEKKRNKFMKKVKKIRLSGKEKGESAK